MTTSTRREFMALAAGTLSAAAVPRAVAASAAPAFRIAVLSDVQGYPYPEDAGMRNLERALDALAPLKPDLVVNVGDINDSGRDMDAVRYFKQRCDARLGKLPHVACDGNHEICFVPKELKATCAPEVCRNEFNAIFGQDPTARRRPKGLLRFAIRERSQDARDADEHRRHAQASVRRSRQKTVGRVRRARPQPRRERQRVALGGAAQP